MHTIQKFLVVSIFATGLTSGALYAQDHHDEHHDHPYVRHDEWKKGYHMSHDDWSRAEKIDYRDHHLNAPPRGYEWREVDGNYVLGAIATGVIASAIVASAAH